MFQFSNTLFITCSPFVPGAGSGAGHLQLFRSCSQWLEVCKNYLVEKNVIEKLEKNIPSGRHLIMVEHTCMLLNYVRIFCILHYIQEYRYVFSSSSCAKSSQP